MSDPHGTLSIFAEVSIALAGFSGIVIAVGKRSLGSMSALESRRLSNLFFLSGVALGMSLIGLSLLSVGFTDPNVIWVWGSATIFLIGSPWLVRDAARVFRLEAAERAQVNKPLILTFNALAIAMLALQLANWLSIHREWPFFLALVMIIAGALQQFILLVRSGLNQRAHDE